MDISMDNLGKADNIVTQNYLSELLSKVIALKTSISEKQSGKTNVATELDSIASKLQDTIMTTAELKSKYILASTQPHEAANKDKFDGTVCFKQQYSQLQQVLGIEIKCTPEKKLFEIMFNDAKTVQTTLSFSYNDKRIELDEMHPMHPNFDAIRENLRETGDLLGFLSVLSKKLSIA